MPERSFIADVHLGKLAKALRLLGFDMLYSNTFTAVELLARARSEDRILLSRSTAFAKHMRVRSFVIRSEVLVEQLQQVVQQFQLQEWSRPFTRCLVCNGLVATVAEEAVSAQLEPNTRLYYSDFWQCQHCGKVYWNGAHYNRMLTLVQAVAQR